MATKKVATVTIQYPPTIGGLQAHVRGIVDLVEELGYETVVITSKPNPTMKIEGRLGSNVIQLPVIKWFKDSPIINLTEIYSALKKTNPDIVHIVYPFPISLDVACFYAILNKKKLVCTYIDDVFVEFPFSIIVKLYENILWRLWLKKIDAISVSSEEYGKNSSGLKSWRENFCIVPPPVFDTDFKLTLEMKWQAKKELGLDKYDKVVLFVGGLRRRLYYKRPDMLLKAWSEFTKEVKGNYVLVIVGDGEMRPYYENLAQSLGLTKENTIFMGYVPRDTLIKCYLAGDVFVLPSQDNNEAFGITAVEAMLYGNIVIASDIPGIRGAVKRDEKSNVSLVPPLRWDKIVNELKYWFSRDLSKYALKNYEYVKRWFNKERIKEEVRRLYDE